MYAVIETGGKQFRVAPGDTIEVETLAGEPGAQIDIGRVIAVFRDEDGQLLTGNHASGARVTGTIAGHDRGEKVIVFKFKRKKQYKRTIGHRQNLTRVKIDGIVV
jgi:large subunit ribosomal protein L21